MHVIPVKRDWQLLWNFAKKVLNLRIKEKCLFLIVFYNQVIVISIKQYRARIKGVEVVVFKTW